MKSEHSGGNHCFKNYSEVCLPGKEQKWIRLFSSSGLFFLLYLMVEHPGCVTGCFLGRSDLAWLATMVTVTGREEGAGLSTGLGIWELMPGYGGGGVFLTPSLFGLPGCELGGVRGRKRLGTTWGTGDADAKLAEGVLKWEFAGMNPELGIWAPDPMLTMPPLLLAEWLMTTRLLLLIRPSVGMAKLDVNFVWGICPLYKEFAILMLLLGGLYDEDEWVLNKKLSILLGCAAVELWETLEEESPYWHDGFSSLSIGSDLMVKVSCIPLLPHGNVPKWEMEEVLQGRVLSNIFQLSVKASQTESVGTLDVRLLLAILWLLLVFIPLLSDVITSVPGLITESYMVESISNTSTGSWSNASMFGAILSAGSCLIQGFSMICLSSEDTSKNSSTKEELVLLQLSSTNRLCFSAELSILDGGLEARFDWGTLRKVDLFESKLAAVFVSPKNSSMTDALSRLAFLRCSGVCGISTALRYLSKTSSTCSEWNKNKLLILRKI